MGTSPPFYLVSQENVKYDLSIFMAKYKYKRITDVILQIGSFDVGYWSYTSRYQQEKADTWKRLCAHNKTKVKFNPICRLDGIWNKI